VRMRVSPSNSVRMAIRKRGRLNRSRSVRGANASASRRASSGGGLQQREGRDVRPDGALEIDPEAAQVLGREGQPERELAAFGVDPAERARVEVLDLIDVQLVRPAKG